MRKILIIVLSLLLAACHVGKKSAHITASQSQDKPPYACQPVTKLMHHGMWQLQFDKNKLLVIANVSQSRILLDKHDAADNPGASAGWASMIAPGHYSALHYHGSFVLQCRRIDVQFHTAMVNCAKVLKLYWLPVTAKSADMLNGGYWVSENKSKTQLYHVILQRGFSIRKGKGY